MSLFASRFLLAGPSAFFVAATASDSTSFASTNSSAGKLPSTSSISSASPACVSSASASSSSTSPLSSSSSSSSTSSSEETLTMNFTSTTLLAMRSPSTAALQRCHRAATGGMATWGAALAAQTTVALRLLLSLLSLVLLLQSVLQSLWRVLTVAFWRVWEWPSTRRLRKKLFFELAVAVLGPSGNSVILLVLWPGWFVLAPAFWVMKICVVG